MLIHWLEAPSQFWVFLKVKSSGRTNLLSVMSLAPSRGLRSHSLRGCILVVSPRHGHIIFKKWSACLKICIETSRVPFFPKWAWRKFFLGENQKCSETPETQNGIEIKQFFLIFLTNFFLFWTYGFQFFTIFLFDKGPQQPFNRLIYALSTVYEKHFFSVI
jgi:hypothetical protein